MKYHQFTYLFLVLILLSGAVLADKTPGNLYRVKINNLLDAEKLNSVPVVPVYRLYDGYLVIADETTADLLEKDGLVMEFLAADVSVELLAIDNRRDRENTKRFPVVFEEDHVRLLKIDYAGRAQSEGGRDLVAIDNTHLEISYHVPPRIDARALLSTVDLDTIVNRVSQDSVTSYLNRLQAYRERLTGTDSCNAAGSWIRSKFLSYGYTDVSYDYFYGQQLPDYHYVTSRNVVAVKPGSLYPDQHIVVGAHYDGVPQSPAADDNGTGVVGVLEIARALKNIETEMTFVFITFDSEESGLIGSEHYADNAAANGDSIVFMLNMDMIGHYTNSAHANLYYGSERAYSLLWGQLASELVGITGHLAGSSTRSDHAPFIQNGYDAIFVQEYDFSTVYHSQHDSTTYVNNEYVTRMIKASLATVFTVNRALPAITVTHAYDAGDGESVEVHWLPGNMSIIDSYRLYYDTEPASHLDSILVSKDSTRYMVSGLTEGQRYGFYVIADNNEGRSSIQYNKILGTPYHLPLLPANQQALPLLNGIKLTWQNNNKELDFKCYQVIRDGGLLPDIIDDTFFIDDDPALGTDIHGYFVVAVDDDDNISDTSGVAPLLMKAATLDANRILAINRTSYNYAISKAYLTGQFLNEALGGYYYDYLSDSAYLKKTNNIDLIDLVDYGLLVIGAESGAGYDDIGQLPQAGGILEDIAYYLSLGGKAVIFGRWGNISTLSNQVTTVTYPQGTHNEAYVDVFQVYSRTLPLSYVQVSNYTISSDLVGAHSQLTGFPDLVWDSTATHTHSTPFTPLGGIPCQSLPNLNYAGIDIVYTYDSGTDSALTEGWPVAWRHLGSPYQFYFFDIPFSFINRTAAVVALRQALTDLGFEAPEDADLDGVPDFVDNCPSDYNPLQEDNDHDGMGDICDDDDDDDGILDINDNCQFVSNPDQADSDFDGAGDLCDLCPGYDDNLDGDEDGVPDDCDNCPLVANTSQQDADDDSIGDVCDNCPMVANSDQLNSDGDSFGDVCDNCPNITNEDQLDSDGDLVGNVCDNCPLDYNPGQEDTDNNGTGDACCCIGFTGNTDCSGNEDPDISDITRLIDFLYLSHLPLCCPGEADVDRSGGDPDISDITRLIDYLYLSGQALPSCP
ncbi:MAG: M28 family peptidase [candidate division Zixibacteria bacterium]|nr:M28 family peptidase [candidate division Zixibacteria bacterium]